MPKQERATATRAAILAAAAAEFEEHGFDGARLDGISRRGGLSKGSMYFHFESKIEIARALVAATSTNWSIVVADVAGGGARGLDAAAQICMKVAEIIGDDVQVRASMSLTQNVSQLRPVLDPYEQWTQLLCVFVEQAIQDGDVERGTNARAMARLAVMAFFGTYAASRERGTLSDFSASVRDIWLTISEIATVTSSRGDAHGTTGLP